jgi:hypothetical protein
MSELKITVLLRVILLFHQKVDPLMCLYILSYLYTVYYIAYKFWE